MSLPWQYHDSDWKFIGWTEQLQSYRKLLRDENTCQALLGKYYFIVLWCTETLLNYSETDDEMKLRCMIEWWRKQFGSFSFLPTCYFTTIFKCSFHYSGLFLATLFSIYSSMWKNLRKSFCYPYQNQFELKLGKMSVCVCGEGLQQFTWFVFATVFRNVIQNSALRKILLFHISMEVIPKILKNWLDSHWFNSLHFKILTAQP